MLTLSKTLVLIGLSLIFLGGIVYLLNKWGFSVARMPGNLTIQRENFTCVFALGASIVLSILLTIILNVLSRLK